MSSSDKVEIAIRAGQIAHRILGLLESNGQLHANLVVMATAKMLKELDDKIRSLPEDK